MIKARAPPGDLLGAKATEPWCLFRLDATASGGLSNAYLRQASRQREYRVFVPLLARCPCLRLLQGRVHGSDPQSIQLRGIILSLALASSSMRRRPRCSQACHRDTGRKGVPAVGQTLLTVGRQASDGPLRLPLPRQAQSPTWAGRAVERPRTGWDGPDRQTLHLVGVAVSGAARHRLHSQPGFKGR